MAVPDISKFRSIINSKGGLAKSARFRARIVPGNAFLQANSKILQDLPFMCTDAEMAGVSLNTVDARYYGPSFKTPSQAIFNDVTLYMFCGEDMAERLFFGDWIQYILGDGTHDFRFRNEYATTMFVDKFREQDTNNTEMTFEFRNVYPVNVLPVPVSWGDEAFFRAQVQFCYTHFIQHGRITDNVA